jgi:hypothetical protein
MFANISFVHTDYIVVAWIPYQSRRLRNMTDEPQQVSKWVKTCELRIAKTETAWNAVAMFDNYKFM